MKGNNLYCKKLVLKLGENVTPTVIFGIIKEEDEKGFTFLTGRGNVYKIHKESYYVTLEDWQGIETFMTYYECLGNPKHKQYISIIKRELPDHNKIVNVSLMPF